MPSDNAQPGVPERAVRVHRLTTLFVWAVLLVLFLRFFPAVKMMILGVLAAGCVAAAMRPIMVRVPGPRVLRGTVAGLLPALVFAAVLFGIGWAMKGPVRKQFEQWPQVRERLDAFLANLGERLGIGDALNVDTLLGQARGILVDQQVLSTTTNLLAAVLLALAFIFFGSIFMLIERERTFLEPVERLLPLNRRRHLAAMADDLEPKLRWWLIGTLISMTAVGVLSGIGYSIIGLEFALPVAILAGVAEIVPTVGPAIAFIIAIVIGLSQGSSTAIGVVVVYAVIQTIESYVLLPLVMKKSVHIPPLVTLFTVVLWGQIFGAAGLFLAIPLDLVIWSALTHFVGDNQPPSTAGAQADRPPESPQSPANTR